MGQMKCSRGHDQVELAIGSRRPFADRGFNRFSGNTETLVCHC
jgi:hypothetical protein